MKKLLLTALVFSAIPLANATNFSDDLDKNTTSAPFEEREEEVLNSGDAFDENKVPAEFEDRAEQEEVESNVIQRDDPEKTYDPLDEEADEL